jgi:hypothetical protein
MSPQDINGGNNSSLTSATTIMTSSSTPTNPTGIIHHQQPSPILSSTGVTATGNSLFPGLVDPTIAKRQRLAVSAFAATQAQAQAVAAQVAALQQAAAIAQQQQQQHQAFMSNAGMLAGVPVSSSALQHALWAGKIAQMSHSHKHETKISEPQMSNLLILGQNASNATTGTSNSSTPGQQQQQQSSGTRERDTSSTASQLDISTQQQPNAVLRVIIDSMIYPVTLDVLHSIFSRYGKVLRIITFNKNSMFLFYTEKVFLYFPSFGTAF